MPSAPFVLLSLAQFLFLSPISRSSMKGGLLLVKGKKLLKFLLPFPCSTLTPGHDPVQKVTLVPRGQARGLTWFIPSDDPTLISKQQLFARIVGGLGGRAAEEVIFGEPEVTTGAAGDLQQITGLAKQASLNSFTMLATNYLLLLFFLKKTKLFIDIMRRD